MAQILVVDDERSIRITLSEFLKDTGYEVDTAENADQAMEKLTAGNFDVVLTDIIMPRITGVGLLEAIKEVQPLVQVILITGEPAVETAAEAVRADAFDYLTKPVNHAYLIKSVANAVKLKLSDDERHQLAKENHLYQENLEEMVKERTAELKESEARYRKLFETVPVGIYHSTPDGRFIDGNPTLMKILGFPDRETMLTFDIKDLYLDKKLHEKRTDLIEKDGFVSSYRMQVRRYDGTLIWVQDRANTTYDNSGKILRYYGRLENITKQVQVEIELQSSEKKYRSLIETTNTGYLIVNQEGYVIDANHEYLRLAGRKNLDEILGKNVVEWTAEHDLEKNKKEIEKCYQKGFVRGLEIDYVDEKGKITPIEINASVIEKGGEKQIITLCRDITERVKAKKALQKNMQQLETLHTVTTALSTSLELDKILELILAQMQKSMHLDSGAVFLYEEDSLQVMADIGIIPSAKGCVFSDENALFKEIAQTHTPLLLKNMKEDTRFENWGQSENVENWMGIPLLLREKLMGFITLDSHQKDIQYSTEKINLAESFAAQAAQAIHNARLYAELQEELMRRTEAEKKIWQSRENQRILLDNIQTQIWYLKDEHTYGIVNQAHANFCGINIKELADGDIFELFPSRIAKERIKENKMIFESGKALSSEEWVRNASGEKRLLSISKSLKLDENENVEYLICSAQDITEKRQAEEEVIESKNNLDEVIQQSLQGTTVTDSDGNYKLVNAAFCEMVGYSEDELLEMSIFDLKAESQDKSFFSEASSIQDGLPVSDHLKKKDGTQFVAEISEKNIQFGGENHILGLIRDITEEVQMRRLQSIQYRLAQAGNRARTPEKLYAEVHRIIKATMPAENFYIALTDTKTDNLEMVYLDDQFAPIPSLTTKNGLTEYVYKTGRTLFTTEIEIENMAKSGEITPGGAIAKTWLGVPLIANGKKIGVMAAQHYKDAKAFKEKDKELFELISTSIANVVSQQLAEAETRTYAKSNALLFEASQKLSQSLNFDTLYTSLYELIATSMDVDTFILSEYDIEEKMIYGKFMIYEGEKEDVSILPPIPLEPEDKGVQSHVIRSGISLLINDLEKYLENTDTIYYINNEREIGDHESIPEAEERTQSLLVTPLKLKGEVIGVLQVMSYKDDAYTPYQLNFLEALAAQVSLSTNNAKLYELAQIEIKEREQAEKMLVVSEEKFRSVIQAQRDLIYRYLPDENGTITLVNDAYCQFVGKSADEIVGTSHFDKIANEKERETVREHIARLSAENPIATNETMNINGNGEPHWFEWINQALFDENKGIVEYQAIGRDITEEMQVQTKLNLQSHAMESAANAIVITNATGEIEWVNTAFNTLTGYSIEDAQGENPRLLKSGNHDNTFYTKIWDTILAGNIWQGELINKRKDGSLYHEDMSISPVLSKDGEITNFIAIKQDISEKVEKEKILQEQEEQFRQLFDNMSSAVAVYEAVDNGKDFIFKNFNKAGEKLEKMKKEKLLGKSVLEIFPGIKSFGLLDVFQRVWKTGKSEYHPISIYQDKRIKGWRENYIYKLPNGEIIAAYDDVTERKKAEAEVIHHLSELETLYESSLAISGLLDQKEIANRLIEVLEEKLEWHHVVIRSYDEGNDEVKILGVNLIGVGQEEIQTQISHLNKMVSSPDEGLSGWVIKHKESARISNLSKDKRYVRSYKDINSGLYAPMMVGDKVTGSIAVESKRENAFSVEDERLLNTLANQAAISLENAKLYLDIQYQLEQRAQAEEDLRKLNKELEERVALRTAEIELAHHRIELATSIAGLGIWESLENKDTQFWDKNMYEIYGVSPEEYNPSFANWLKFIPEEYRKEIEEKRPSQFQHDINHEIEEEYHIIQADGSLRQISTRAILLYDEKEKCKKIVGVDMDITKIKESEEFLRHANIELERALRIKDEFLANMSHELRTPLNAILGLSESLLEKTAGPVNDKQEKYLKTVNESGRHLLSLINDILDLAKVESGEVDLDMEKVNIQQVCDASIRMLKQQAQKKNQKLSCEIDKKLNIIWADERRLKQMLVNLLSNAVKFTPIGSNLGIKVQTNTPHNKIFIKVWDEGIGISEEDQKRLFTPFVQIDTGLSRKNVGTGLGLALVKQIAHLHKGNIKLESVVNQGSTFTITLPMQATLRTGPLPSLPKIIEEKPQTAPKKGYHILLVDDTEATLMMLTDYFKKKNFQVSIAKNGLEGITKAAEHHPDLILMDVMMPLMDGLEATRKIKSNPALKKTPIIGMTALAMPKDRENCLEAGMDDYMSKPLIFDELLSLIQEYLS